MKKKIYLAGAFTSWRKQILENTKHDYYNPETDTDQSSICRFTSGDIDGVKLCDMIFVYSEEGSENVGSSMEIGVAVACKIPVILCTNKKFIFPLHAGAALRILNGLDVGIFYLNALYESENEFEAAYKTMKHVF